MSGQLATEDRLCLITFSMLVKKRFGNRNCLFETEERSKEATNTAP